MADKTKMIAELKERIAKLQPLPDEPDFSTADETIIRYLKSRDWDLEAAEKMLSESIEYRRRTRPLTLECSWCHNRPGFHSMRQVGHDEAGRPVIYANFAQASTHKNTTEDSVAHVTYLIENAKRTMTPGVSTWVFVIDCTGMTLSSCNPKLGYGVTNSLSNHYPERLGQVVCLNHSPVFHGVWKAIKQFLHPQTAAKVKLVRSKSKMTDLFSRLFSAELSHWLLEEIALNKQKPLSKPQVEFWNPPSSSTGKPLHDPRGTPTYVTQYLETFKKACQSDSDGGSPNLATPLGNEATPFHVHKPHPNIVDHLTGREVAAVSLSKEELLERQRAQSMVEKEGGKGEKREGEEVEEGDFDLDIPSDLQIPANAVRLGTGS
ncbi:phosphatidylinositol transfer protein 3-like [Littorina saxatilis]|uniref:CRAL-TRIO domain-containing protein n=1 Tax=Littorina saxatilis TaxID=31220 RepID=A0AAN9BZK6_9CAEN